MKIRKLKPKKLKKYLPTILSAGACVGVIFTAVASSKAAVKAEKEETTAGKIKCYIWTAIMAGTTIVCIIGSDRINRKRQAGLLAAYALLEKRFREYQTGVKEVLGDDAHQQVVEHIVKSECTPPDIWRNDIIGCSVLVPNDLETPEITRTFYDMYSKRYFESTLAKVLEAEMVLIQDYSCGKEITINDFYDLLGLPHIKENMAWNFEDGLYTIEFDNRKTNLEDGMEVITINMPYGPTEYPDQYDYL